MGYPLTSPSDYKGIIAISTNKYTAKDLELFIETYEQCILQELLGCDMEAEFIADLDGSNEPQDVKFQYIYNAFCEDDKGGFLVYDYPQLYNYHSNYNGYGCRIQWKSKGILDLLRYQIYFLYTRDQAVKNTITGNVNNVNVVSELQPNYNTNMLRNYNTSLDTYHAIQWRICKNELDYDYDSFNGIFKEPIGIV